MELQKIITCIKYNEVVTCYKFKHYSLKDKIRV